MFGRLDELSDFFIEFIQRISSKIIKLKTQVAYDSELKRRVSELEALFSKQPNLLKGNLQVIACAGAGKTDFISWRIAFLIKNNLCDPENIVAFTFTERAAEELKFRIRHHIKYLLGHQPDMGDMYVGTIHSFCFRILQEFVPKYRVFEILDEGKQYAFVSSLTNDLNFEWLKGSLVKRKRKPYGINERSWIWNTFLRSVDIIREEMLDPQKISVSDSFTEAFHKYGERLDDKQFLDFSSMMSIAVDKLRSNDKLLADVRAKYTHFTVDEYQDINPIQEVLIELLAGKNGNLCVVGDDDQAIYQWRGSTVENILTFKKRYKGVQTFPLPHNYRSTDTVVSCSNTLIANNEPNRLQKSMVAQGGKGEKGDIYKLVFSTQDEEIKFIVKKIKEMIGTEIIEKNKSLRGLTYSDIAIFFRSVAYDAQPYIKALKDAKIPVAISGIGGLFESTEADVIFDLFAYLGEFQKIWDRNSHEGYIPALRNIYERAKTIFPISSEMAFVKYFDGIKEQSKNSRRVSLQGLYGDILWGLGLFSDEMHKDEKEIILYNLGRVSMAITDYEATRTYTTRSDIRGFCWFIRQYAESHYDAGEGEDPTLALNAVQTMTLHGAKGLGFQVVFMPYCVERRAKEFESGYLNPSKFDFTRYKGSDQDERRLFYVGMTRAKKFLFLSYPQRVSQRRTPLKYFNEVPDSHCITTLIPDPSKRQKVKPKPAEDAVRFPTNYSELRYYLSCAYDYKLRFIYGFNPELVQALGYGKQVHNVINILHKGAQKTGKIPSIKEAEKIVNSNFYLRYAAEAQIEKLKRSAFKCIENYIRMWKEDFELTVKTERPFELDVENALISGSIDLLRRQKSVDRDILEIIDFKTGKDRVQNEETDLQIQLYTFAAREALNLNVQKAYLHYLDDENAERREVLTTPKQLNLAMQTVTQAVRGITSRSFPRDPKSKHNCKECDWKKICPAVR